MIIFRNDTKYNEYKYKLEEDFEKDVINNSSNIFGADSIYIDIKRKIVSKTLGGTIPDGILFDFSDLDNPGFYLVEFELSKHSFFNHIFPQITKFFAFFNNSKSRTDLIEKIFSIINTDDNLKKTFKEYLDRKEIYKSLKDITEKNQNILLIIDGEKFEIPEIMETYYETWGKTVKILLVKKYMTENETLFTVDPEFENIEYSDIGFIPQEEGPSQEYTENKFLDKVNKDVKEKYEILKKNITSIDKEIVFNPQKYYVSIRFKKNIAYFKFRQKKIRLVVMYPEDDVKNIISNHSIKSLSSSVQKFYGSPCCALEIIDKKYLSEIVDLIEIIIKEIKRGE